MGAGRPRKDHKVCAGLFALLLVVLFVTKLIANKKK